MSKKENPLPKPPSTPFGRKRSFEDPDSSEPLMADRMAMAMSEGKLDEFLEKEMPDSEHARKLAEMMLGMTGMMPSEGLSVKPSPKKEGPSDKAEDSTAEEISSASTPPEDVVNAVHTGDVSSLVEMLKREHRKRSPGTGAETVEEEKKEDPPSAPRASVEKETIDQLIKIASDNELSPDWIFFRALKRYVEEYQKTGNL